MTLALATADPRVVAEPMIESGLALFFRRNGFGGKYRPVENRSHAEWLLGSTNFDSPWVTLLQGEIAGDHTYFQVLGEPHRLLCEGGIRIGDLYWNWRATAIPGDNRTVPVGPPWYRETVQMSDVLTVHDALCLLWAALADDVESFPRRAGLRAVYL